jgi:hypothetical protein
LFGFIGIVCIFECILSATFDIPHFGHDIQQPTFYGMAARVTVFVVMGTPFPLAYFPEETGDREKRKTKTRRERGGLYRLK